MDMKEEVKGYLYVGGCKEISYVHNGNAAHV